MTEFIPVNMFICWYAFTLFTLQTAPSLLIFWHQLLKIKKKWKTIIGSLLDKNAMPIWGNKHKIEQSEVDTRNWGSIIQDVNKNLNLVKHQSPALI